jgi:flagellar biosynthesis/type III secretory pathway protein FliH
MGRVIKGGTLEPELLGALDSGRDIIEQAHRSARAIVDEAQRRVLEQDLARAAAALVDARQARSQARADGVDDLVELSLEIARRLYDRARDEDPDVVRDLCLEALSKMAGAQSVTLRTNPADLDAASVLATPGSAIRVVADPGIGAGGCVVESELGTADGRIETRLDALRLALRDVTGPLGDDG